MPSPIDWIARAKASGNFRSTLPGWVLSVATFEEFEAAVSRWLESSADRRFDVDGSVAVPVVGALPIRLTCGIAQKIVIDAIFENVRWSVVARRIGRAVAFEALARSLPRSDGYVVAKATEMGKSPTLALRRMNLDVDIDPKIAAIAGIVLLELFASSTGMIAKSKTYRHRQWDIRLQPTDAARQWCDETIKRGVRPMLVPEVDVEPWTSRFDGGSPLDDRGIIRAPGTDDVTVPVIEAANAAQRVRWRVDRDVVLELMKTTHDARHCMLAAQALTAPDTFCFGYSYDFRGRMYPQASGLSPHGDSFCKAVLKFPPQAMTPEGRAEFESLRHLKMSKEEQVSYDLDAGHRGDATGHLVRLDGRANGLQIIGLLTRDSKLCTETGVDGSRRDIYQTVANMMNQRIEEEVSHVRGDMAAHTLMRLNGPVDRALAKKLTMVIPYGVTDFGLRQILEEHLRPLAAKARFPMKGLRHPMRFFIEAFRASLVAIAPKALELIDVVKSTSIIRDLTWTTPDGFSVVHKYNKTKVHQARTRCNGRVITSIYGVETPEVDIRATIGALVPNLVHSFDGAVARSVLRSAPFPVSVVHDSFACHPNNAMALRAVIRQSVIKTFEADHLNAFLAALNRPSMSLGEFDPRETSLWMYSK